MPKSRAAALRSKGPGESLTFDRLGMQNEVRNPSASIFQY